MSEPAKKVKALLDEYMKIDIAIMLGIRQPTPTVDHTAQALNVIIAKEKIKNNNFDLFKKNFGDI